MHATAIVETTMLHAPSEDLTADLRSHQARTVQPAATPLTTAIRTLRPLNTSSLTSTCTSHARGLHTHPAHARQRNEQL